MEIRVDAVAASDDGAHELAQLAEAAALEEMLRLQAVFSVYDPDSELCRWRAGDTDDVSGDLSTCLAAAEQWWRLSGGAFHPAAGQLRALWLAADQHQRLPDEQELGEVTAGLARLPFLVDHGLVRRTGDCSGVDLNAIAKGYIVDRAVLAAATASGVVDVLVNAGGDLRHRGDRELRVGVEHPADGAGEPAAVIPLADGAVATSGSVHRGFRIAGTWYSHVLDPRTGRPVAGRPSTTIRAPDAMTADAVATIANVLDWREVENVLSTLPGMAALAVDTAGAIRRSGSWLPGGVPPR